MSSSESRPAPRGQNTDVVCHRCIDGWMDGWMDWGWVGGWTDE